MKVAILGCGWLGLPLAKRLLEKGHTVAGSTTSQEKLTSLESEGIRSFLITVSPEGIQGDLSSFLADADVVIVNIPPGLRRDPEKNFMGTIEKLAGMLISAEIKKLIFVSSTSVYEDTVAFPIYTEKDAPNAQSYGARQMVSAEELLLNLPLNTSVLRFGGLIGEDRHPVKYLAGRKDLSDPEAPVNLIHRNDCIGIIEKLLDSKDAAGLYNAVFPRHPGRKEYYTSKAREEGLPEPLFDESAPSQGKIVLSLRVEEELKFEFTHGIV